MKSSVMGYCVRSVFSGHITKIDNTLLGHEIVQAIEFDVVRAVRQLHRLDIGVVTCPNNQVE